MRRGIVRPLAGLDAGRRFAPRLDRGGSSFTYRDVEFRVPLPGRHNAENALQAVLLCEMLGYAAVDIARALAGFRGIKRRLELVGTVRDITVIDDYAHNPAKIEAAWQTVKPYARRVLGVWRPHGFAPLAHMMESLAELLPRLCTNEDELLLLPVYYAGGTAQRSVSAQDLADRLAGRGVRVSVVTSFEELDRRLTASARPGDTILCMGARDPDLPLFARRLVARLEAAASV